VIADDKEDLSFPAYLPTPAKTPQKTSTDAKSKTRRTPVRRHHTVARSCRLFHEDEDHEEAPHYPVYRDVDAAWPIEDAENNNPFLHKIGKYPRAKNLPPRPAADGITVVFRGKKYLRKPVYDNENDEPEPPLVPKLLFQEEIAELEAAEQQAAASEHESFFAEQSRILRARPPQTPKRSRRPSHHVHE